MVQSDVERMIEALARDLLTDPLEDGKYHLAINCEPDRRLLALLVAYSLGEELADKVLGDENNA